MSVQFSVEDSNIVVFHISGELEFTEYKHAQKDCEAVIAMEGKIRILVVLHDFRGWQKAKGWEDLSFTEKNDPFIEKMAIVGDDEWKPLVYAFTAQGLRPVDIQFFPEQELSTARRWLR